LWPALFRVRYASFFSSPFSGRLLSPLNLFTHYPSSILVSHTNTYIHTPAKQKEGKKERKKGRKEERKKGRKEERKKGRKEERKKGRKEERKKGRKEENPANHPTQNPKPSSALPAATSTTPLTFSYTTNRTLLPAFHLLLPLTPPAATTPMTC
jgi:hypothetical protein